MLDIMELRGFKVHAFSDHPWELETPDGYCYVIVKSSLSAEIKVAFSMFQSLNHHYK